MFSALSHFIFGANSFFGSHHQAEGTRASTWRDKKLSFDLRSSDLELDQGEQLIGCFYPIEDVKGNQDELGLLKVTNLRLVWICCKKKRVNLSIGWRTVTLAYEQQLKDGLCGSSASLFVLSKYDATKYEFVFSKKSSQIDIWMGVGGGGGGGVGGVGSGGGGSGNPDNWASIAQLRKFSQDKAALISHLSPMYLDDPFEVVFKVWQAYKQTHLFRHCRSNLANLISAPTSAGAAVSLPTPGTNNFKLSDVNKLPSEEIIETFTKVHQIESKSTKYVGTLLLTNVRIIWIDDSLPLRNLSIPYIRIESIKTKQGDKIVVNAHDYLANSTHVDFQVHKSALGTNKAARLIGEQIQNLYALYKSKPRYGPESCEDSINYMSHLRPIEHYFDSIDRSFVKTLENFGPAANVTGSRDRGGGGGGDKAAAWQAASERNDEHDKDMERLESDLDGYRSKLASYLNERPLHLDNEVVYSPDLGLAVERPVNGASLKSIWRIDI